jgi:subtilisin family serine protease
MVTGLTCSFFSMRQGCVWAKCVPDSISGIDWVAKAAGNSSRPSVASMSFGGGYLASINAAAANLVSSGVTTVVAAGNSDDDAAFYSPASTPSAITVGATDIDDTKAYYSNYGNVLDIWAPGEYRIETVAFGTV